MTKLLSFLAALLLSLDASAAGIRFEPAAPDNRSWIRARVHSGFCAPLDPVVTINGSVIDITGANASGGGCVAIPYQIPLDAQIGILPAGVYTVRVNGGMLFPALDTLVVRDTRAFRVLPAGAPSSGGVTVELQRASGAPWNPFVRTTVQFGETDPLVLPFPHGSRIEVQVPPRAPGVVDVKVTQGEGTEKTETIARAAFTYYDPLLPRDRTVFEPILFPIAYRGPGAFGSIWATDNWIASLGLHPACSGCEDPQRLRIPFDSPSGFVLWRPRGTFDRFGASSRVRDTTKQADNAGAYVPVAREGDFASSLVFPDVPSGAKYRVMLRVWALVEPQVTVTPAVTVGSTRSSVPLMASPEEGFLFGSAELTALTGAPEGSHVVEVQGGLGRIWGIISVTNNETQQVTIVAPRPGVASER